MQKNFAQGRPLRSPGGTMFSIRRKPMRKRTGKRTGDREGRPYAVQYISPYSVQR